MSTCFVCRACGSADLALIHEYATTVRYATRAPCTCGRSLHEIAAIRYFHVTVISEDSGRLWQDGAWEAAEHEDVAWLGATEDSFTLLCPACAEQTGHALSDLLEMGREQDRRAEFYYVRCYRCDGDIELHALPDQERVVGLRMAL